MADFRDAKDRAPNPTLISMLENRLEQAKAGEIRSAVIVTSAADNATGHGWALDGRTRQQPVLAQMMIAQNEMMLRISATETSGILRQFIE